MRTTININADLKNRILHISKSLDIPKKEIISCILDIIQSKRIFRMKAFNTIRYQKVDPEKNWETLHINFNMRDYEVAHNLSRTYRFSVSFLLSFGFLHFLDKIIKKIMNSRENNIKMDNYPLSFHFIVKKLTGFQGLMILWGNVEERNLKEKKNI